MDDLTIARVLLYRKVNYALDMDTIYTNDLINIIKNFLTKGCKTREDYEFMINELFANDYYNRMLLLKN